MTNPKGRVHAARAALASVGALALVAACGWSVRPLPLLAQEAASAVQDVTLQDVSLPFGATILTAPKVTVSGTRLSKDDLMGILKADSPEPWAARLARLDAASLTIPELRTVHTGPGESRQTTVYRDVAARDVRAGRIAELTASGATITVAGGEDGGSGTYGRIAASGVDLAAMARLYGVSGDGKGPIQTIYATVAIADVAFTDQKGTVVKLAGLSGRDLGGRQVPGGWTGATETLSRLDFEKLEGPERAKAATTVADLIEGISAGAVEAKGLSVSETKGAEPLAFEIGRMAFALPAPTAKSDAVATAAPDSAVTVEGIAFSKAGMRSRIQKIALAGFSLAPTVAALRKLAAVDPKKPDASSSDDAMRRLTPTIGTLTIDDMSLDLPADAAPAPPPEAAPAKRLGNSLDDAVRGAARAKGADKSAVPVKAPVAAPPMHVGLRNATLAFGPVRDGVPTSSRLSLSGLTMPSGTVAAVPGLGGLSSYGYGDLDLNAVVDSNWDEGKREIVLREVSVAGKDMGTVRLSGTIGGIGPEMFDPDAATSGLAMLSATAKALDLTVENTGLFERFITAQSKTLSLKPDELRQEYVTASMLGVPVILGNSPAAKAIGAAMGQFVTKPGKLTISAKAKDANGVGVADFSTAGSPGAVLDKLDVTAKSE